MAEVPVDKSPKKEDLKTFTDGGPWVEHNMFCAVCHDKPAVYLLGSGILQPCWDCQRKGYKLCRRRKGWWARLIYGVWEQL